MRLRLRAAGLLALAAVAITCTDAPTGLRSNATAAFRHLQMAPSFTPEAARVYNTLAQAFGIDVTEVHVHLVGSGGTVRDTVIAFPVGVDTLVLDIPVPPGANDEPFNALIELRNDAHTVLFSGTQTVTAHAANLPGISTPVVTISYSGPGRGTKTISITPSDTTVGALASLNYSATAIDSSGKPVTDLLVRWTTSDPTMAATNQVGNAAATISGTGKRGTVTVTATTPQGVAGTARLVLVPAPSRVVVISGGGQTASAGSVLPQPLVVEVQATDNLPVPGASVVFSAVTSGGSVQTATVAADANGRASTQLTLGKTAGTYQFMASSGALTPATVSETATPAPPSAIAVVSGDAQSDSTGQKLALPLVVKVTDQFGGAVGGATVTWTRASGSGALGAATTTTASDGTSSNGYTLGSAAGADVIRATVAGVTTPASFSATTIARGASSVSIVQGGAQSGVAGSVLPVALIAQVKDVQGNPVTGATVSWSAAPAGVTFAPASSATSAQGQASTTATLGTTSGAYMVTATTGTLSATTTLTATPGSAASITKVAGDGQTATAGTAVAVAPSVVVKDANGNVVSGASVTFAVASGGGSVTAATSTTNASGVATIGSWTLGTTAGANTLTATSGALTTTFSATGVAASASKLILLQGLPTTITVGAAFAAPVTVQIADANGNPVAAAGVTVTATASVIPAPPNGAPAITATTNGAGVATFNIPPYVGPVGVVTFTASAAGLTSVSSGQIPIVAGPAAQLLLAVQPSAAATLGVNFPTQPSVQLGDVFGNPVSAAGVSVTASIASGGGTLGGTVTVATNASGVASYTNLSISGTAGTRTLQFSSGALTAVVSSALAVSVGAPASLAKTAGDNQTANAGSAVAVVPTVVVKDAVGNVVPGATVTFAVASGGGSITGATATTDASGVASVGSWTLGSAAGTNTLTATSGTASATFTATGVASSGAKIIPVSGLPTSITVGVPFTAPLVMRITDALGNPVAQAGVQVTITGTITPGNVTLPLAVGVTDASGAVTFTLPTYTGPVGSVVVTASASGLSTFTTSVIPLLTGAADRLVLTTAPSPGVTSGSVLAQQPVVQIADAGGNPVSSAGVDVSVSSSNATIGGTTIVKTNASGAATFTNLDVTSSNSIATLVFSSGTLTSVSANVSVTQNSGSMVFSGGWNPGATVAFKPFNPQPKIQLLDQSGNPVRQAGISVVAGIFAANPGGGSQNIQNPSVFTDAQGIATFTNLIIGGNPGTYTLQFLAGNTASGLTFPPLRFDVQLTAGGPASIVNNGFTNGAQTVVGGTTTQQPSVKVTDQFGSPSVGANVVFTANTPGETITANGVTGTSLTVATDASGIASLNAWRIGTNAQSYQVQASVAGVSTPVVFTTNGVAGAQAGFTAVSIPTSITVGAAIAPLKVQLVDVNGNAVALAGVSVTATGTVSPSGATFGGTVTTDGAGIATFPLPPYTGQTGSGVLVFTSPGLASLTSGSIPIGAGAAANLQVVTQPSSSVTSGVVFPTQPTVRLIDAGGNVVNTPNVSITAFLIFGTGTLTGTTALNTNSSGVVNFTNLAITGSGTHQIQFTPTPGQSQAIMNIISANANAMTVSGASSMIVSAGAGQTAVVASTTAIDPAVKVIDANGVGVPNVTVTFTPRSGSSANGLHSPVNVTTNASGLASVSWIMGQVAGALKDTMDVTSTGLPALKFVASAVAQQGINVIITQQPPSSVTSGAVISPAIVLQYVDVYGNPSAPVPAQKFTALIGSGSGTVSGRDTATTNASGTATFSNLILSGSPGTYSLKFFDGNSGVFVTNTFTLTAGSASQIGFATPWTPGTTGAGTPFATQPVIQLRDANGNDVAQAGVTITATVFSYPGGTQTIQNATATTNASGTATFSGLLVGGLAGNWVINFSSSAGFIRSGTIPIVAGPASVITLLQGDGQTAAAGTNVSITPSVFVKDAYNNNVAGVGVVWTANGGSTLHNQTGASGTTFTINTNASGVSGVGSWTMGPAAQGYTLTAAVTGLTGSPITFNATATAGAPTQVGFATPWTPATTAAGVAFATQPVIQLRDAAGNPAGSGLTVNVTVFSYPGNPFSLQNASAVTNANGTATFSGLSVGGTAGTWTLSFNVAGVGGVQSGNIQIVAGAASSIAVLGGNNQTAAGGSAVPIAPSAIVRDAYNNAVSGVPVTWDAGNGGSSLTNATGTNGLTFTINTNASGVSQVGSWRLGAIAGSYTLTAAATGLTGSPVTFSATATAGAPAGLKFIQQPSNSVGGTTIAPTVSVALVDGAGNTITTNQTATISLALAGGTSGASLTGSGPITVVNGVANFPALSVDISGSGYTLVASTNALSGTQASTAFTVSPGQFGLITTKTGTRQSVDPVGTGFASTPPVFVVRNAAGTLLSGKSVTVTAFGRCLLNNAGSNNTTFNYTSDAVGEVHPAVVLPSASIGSGCSIFATAPTLTSARDSALIAVYPNGRTTTSTHVWMGTVSTNWSTAANWVRPGNASAAPSSTSDIVFIPSFVGAMGNYPTLNGVHPAMLRLQMDTSAVLLLNGNILDVGGSPTIGGVAGFGLMLNGTTRLTANGTLNGVFDKVEVGASGACASMIGALATVTSNQLDMYCAARVDTAASASGNLTVHASGGGLTLASSGAGLVVTGNAFFTGDSLVAQSGTVINVNGAATFGGTKVNVSSASISVNGAATFSATGSANYTGSALVLQGKATFGGTNAVSQTFDGGQMLLLGDFAQVAGASGGTTFVPFNDQITSFIGSGTQAVTAVNSATRFQRVSFANTGGGVTINSAMGTSNGTFAPRFELKTGKLTLGAGVNFTDSGQLVFDAGTTLVLSAGSNLSISNGSCSGHNGMTISGTGTINGQSVTSATCP